MGSIDACIDDGNRCTEASVPGVLPDAVHVVGGDHVSHGRGQKSVELQHDDPRKVKRIGELCDRHPPCHSMDQMERECVLQVHLILQHGHVRIRWVVIEVDDDREGASVI